MQRNFDVALHSSLEDFRDWGLRMFPNTADTLVVPEKVRLNRGSNSQPPGQESDTLTTEPLGGACGKWSKCW